MFLNYEADIYVKKARILSKQNIFTFNKNPQGNYLSKFAEKEFRFPQIGEFFTYTNDI